METFPAENARGAIEQALFTEPLVRQARYIETTNGQVAVALSLNKDRVAASGKTKKEIVSLIRKNVRASTRVRPFPKRWLVLEELSVTATGEVDETKLRELLDEDVKKAEQRTGEKPPGALQMAFAAAHGVSPEQVDPYKSFIELGGDSMGAIEVRNILLRQGFAVTVRDLLSCSQLLDVEMRVGNCLDNSAGSFRSKFGHPTELPQLIWQAKLDEPLQTVSLRMPGHVDDQIIRAALDATLAEFAILQPQGPNTTAYHVHNAEHVADMDLRVSELPRQMRERNSVFEAHLFRVHDTDAYKLVLMAHRLLLDRRSWPILLNSFTRTLTKFARKESLMSRESATLEHGTLTSRLRHAGAEAYLVNQDQPANSSLSVITESLSIGGEDISLLLDGCWLLYLRCHCESEC
ncbi:hypothetical protein RJ55_04882 [Drechmeria coniospora]|nr:hypothetical protein RJ55_04882 [Drechmeria coniospora]